MFWVLILPVFAKAQQLLFSVTDIQFATLTVPASDSVKLVLTLEGVEVDSVIQVSDINSYNEAFSVSDTSFAVYKNEPKEIWVRFKPTHNIKVATQLLFISNASNSSATISLSGIGKYEDSYYASTQNLSEQALKDALKLLITTGQSNCSYNGARDQLFMNIDNKKTNGQGANSNTLECVYTGRQAVGYTSRTDAQTNANFNTEHTWPQSLFSSATPMVCDLHHLFPTDETANGIRSNYPFGIVNNPTWTVGGSEFANNVFEPRDEHKGQVARAMMYFVLRYQDYNLFFAPQETILRQWHKQFLPSEAQVKRNNDIFGFQKNRNPFVDHPEFIERITLLSSTSVAAPTRLLTTNLNAVYFKAITGNGVSMNNGSIALVNIGNQSINYTVAFTSQVFKLNSAAGIISKENAQEIDFYLDGIADSIVLDTLVITSNATNNPIIRIPFAGELRLLGGLKKNDYPAFTFQLYPNPSNSEVNILSQNLTNFTIIITTLQGQIMGEWDSIKTINTNLLNNGLYIVTLKTQFGSKQQKLLINHIH
jgi:endonuclease I